MLLEKTNSHLSSLSDPFDYRLHDNIVVHVGIDLLNLQRIVVGQGASFSEFLDDLSTAIRCRRHSEEELFLLKLDLVCGNYFERPIDDKARLALEQLFDVVAFKIKTELLRNDLYLAGRFDYSVSNHSNYGLLFTKN